MCGKPATEVFGTTVHTGSIPPLCNAAISCSRLIGHNTFDVLAGKIEAVHRQFELYGKLTATITDNRLNFVKAFKMFSADPTLSSTSEEEL